MPGAPSDPWPLMPQTPAVPFLVCAWNMITEPTQRVFRASSPTYCWRHHRLVGARVGRSPCTSPRPPGLPGALDQVTQRGYSRRSVAHIAAVLRVAADRGVGRLTVREWVICVLMQIPDPHTVAAGARSYRLGGGGRRSLLGRGLAGRVW